MKFLIIAIAGLTALLANLPSLAGPCDVTITVYNQSATDFNHNTSQDVTVSVSVPDEIKAGATAYIKAVSTDNNLSSTASGYITLSNNSVAYCQLQYKYNQSETENCKWTTAKASAGGTATFSCSINTRGQTPILTITE